jgi:hypothetical protein
METVRDRRRLPPEQRSIVFGSELGQQATHEKVTVKIIFDPNQKPLMIRNSGSEGRDEPS